MLAKDFESSEIEKLLKQTNLLGTMSNLPPFMPQIVLEFYVNLSKNMGDPSSPNFQKATMRGHRFEFSPSIINQYLECEDVPDDEVEVLETNPIHHYWRKCSNVAAKIQPLVLIYLKILYPA